MVPAAADSKPLLDLATLDPIDRPFVRIDGVRHDLAVPADFGVIQAVKLERLVDRLTEIQGRVTAETMTETDADELSRILAAGVALVLKAPPDVLAKLNESQQLAVVQAFTSASRRKTPSPTTNRKARRSTGARSSQGSPASTRARTS